MSYTPGPWKAVRNCSYWEVVYPWPDQNIDDADDSAPSCAYVWGCSEEVQEANARLIAAAPELLEALIAIKSQLNAKFEVEANIGGWVWDAIDKATGG